MQKLHSMRIIYNKTRCFLCKYDSVWIDISKKMCRIFLVKTVLLLFFNSMYRIFLIIIKERG